MGVKGNMVAEFAKSHSYYETLDFVCKMIGLDSLNDELDITSEKLKYSEDVQKIAMDAKNPVEFWTNLSEEDQKKYATMDELREAYKNIRSLKGVERNGVDVD